jgi:hypothetical protein
VDACDPADGQCDYTNVIVGTTCDFGVLPGVCGAVVCMDAMLCAGVDCSDDNECTQDACDPMDGQCNYANATDGTTCDFGGLPGVCTTGVCEDAMLCAAVDCDDQNSCTQESCDPMDGTCNYANLADGTGCDFGGVPGACLDGACSCAVILCMDGRSYDCGDCLDNDGDGLADDQDPECLGPCDNTEGPVLLSGGPGETGNQCSVDCYFDVGNGSGSGDCQWDLRCDPLQPKDQCPYDPAPNYCPDVQPVACDDQCGAITPNGCDCFGCCTFPELAGMGPGGGDGYVYIGSESGCTFDTVTDPAFCQACTPAGNCLNTCGRCEICLGKSTIPADCFPASAGDRCPIGKQECGLSGDDPCQPGSFCLTGCCTDIVAQ